MGWNHQLDKVADVSPIDILANKSRHRSYLESHLKHWFPGFFSLIEGQICKAEFPDV